MWHSRPPQDPPPFMANAILNFHFDFLTTSLRVTDWDGKPIAFGDIVRYVCQRGYSFEEDPAQLEQTYTCQDGTAPDTNRGFFDVPVEEDEWPRCLRGNSYEK